MTDLELLASWRGGDTAAGEALFARHFRRIYRFFETKCHDEADELVQSTFLRCLRAKDQFRGEASFTTYLFTIARNELYTTFEKRKRDGARLDFSISSIAELAPTPRTRMASREDRARLLHALRGMPVDQQVLLELHYWEALSIAELGEVFDSPQVTVRSRLHRARNALRERMMEDADTKPEVTDTLDGLDAWARGLRDGA